MKKDSKKALYESIMTSVAKEVKKVLNEYTSVFNKNVNSVTMLDVNHRALELATRNSKLNNTNNIKVIESDGFENIDNSYDTIITNPPIRAGKSVIYKMYDNI